ncbi:MAG: pilus assembly protein PilM [Candidatus Omnitrophica bacterium]|nr:pilus assembly protein PilM [Candidatus Omnitrophota bacterium]
MRIPVALEINDKYLKITAAKLIGTHSRVSNYAVEAVSTLTSEQITQLLEATFQKWKMKPSSLILSLSRSLVTVRNLHLPSQDKQEITQMIDLNVARMVPYKRDEILFSYKLLGVDEMGYSKVILAIVKSDSIRKQVKTIENAGYPIDQISLSSYGVADWCYNNFRSGINQTDLYLFLDIDSSFSDFIIF